MKNIRRYDLDWLRVLVFGLLIFYHAGMFFVSWGWHIKNNETYTWLMWPMSFVNQWRLPILFVISGMGTAFALSSRSVREFIRERNARLLIPLIFGILVIVPPQVYVERLVQGDFSGGYFNFWPVHMFDNGAYPEGNFSWHHLWFLPYLLTFSLLLAPLFAWLRDHPGARLLKWLRNLLVSQPYSLFLFVLPLYLYEALLEPFFPVTHNLVWDWFNFISSLTLFFYGFLLISVREAFWKAVQQIWKVCAIIGVLMFSTRVMIWLFLEDTVLVHFTEALISTVNMWAWIIALFGMAARWLNRPSNALAYANRAVYPFYILHQTITVLLGWWLYDLAWGFWPKAFILLAGTFVGSWLIYEFLIRRIRFLQPLFGVKSMSRGYRKFRENTPENVAPAATA